MSGYQVPYEYSLDSSALFDLKRQYPGQVFPGVWDNFNEMCGRKSIIAPREVLNEIKKGNDELIEWAEEYSDIFLEPTEDEYEIMQEILLGYYPPEIISKYGTGRPWADPFVLASAKYHNLYIIQHEVTDPNQYKIPAIAKRLGVNCIRLVELFERESWQFISE
jgi:hypothetical protein